MKELIESIYENGSNASDSEECAKYISRLEGFLESLKKAERLPELMNAIDDSDLSDEFYRYLDYLICQTEEYIEILEGELKLFDDVRNHREPEKDE